MNDLAKKLLSESPFGSGYNEPGSDFRGAGPSDRMRDDSHDIVDHPAPSFGTDASDAERDLHTILGDFESQIEDISNIVFEVAGEIHGRCNCDANQIHEAILDRVKEQLMM